MFNFITPRDVGGVPYKIKSILETEKTPINEETEFRVIPGGCKYVESIYGKFPVREFLIDNTDHIGFAFDVIRGIIYFTDYNEQ